jgi:hypothetical protein
MGISFVDKAFDAEGEPTDPMVEAKLGVLLDDLAWWAEALGRARAEGELPPGQLRMRAAMAASA